jgi:hypothetical protein
MPNFMKSTGLASILTLISASLALADNSSSPAAFQTAGGAQGAISKGIIGIPTAVDDYAASGAVLANTLDTDGARLILEGRDKYFGEIAAVKFMYDTPNKGWDGMHSTSSDVSEIDWKIAELESQDVLGILNGRDRYLN